MYSIATKIKKARVEKGWTQTHLAEHSGLNQPMIAKYESGSTPSAKNLLKIAEALNLPIEYFTTTKQSPVDTPFDDKLLDRAFQKAKALSSSKKSLIYNTTYVLRIVFFRTIKTKDGSKDSTQQYVTAIQRSNHVRTKFADYMKADFGFARVPHINGTIGFTSVHVHFAPINYDADLGKISSFTKEMPLRLSAFFGISPLTIYSDTKIPITKLSAAGNFI